jgi:hypothetical protein
MPDTKRTLPFVVCVLLLSSAVAAVTAGRAASTDAAPARAAAQGADDAKQPYQRMLVLSLDPGKFSDAVSFSVPAGKRLVVETASANAAVPAGQKVTVNLATTGGGLGGRAWLALAAQGSISGLDRYTAAQPLRMYADSGTPVTFQAVRSDVTATASLNFAVAGYLVDAP